MQPDPRTIGHSSPGYLQLGHVPSNETRQIPQSSSTSVEVAVSSGSTFQCHVANPCQSMMLTFMAEMVARKTKTEQR